MRIKKQTVLIAFIKFGMCLGPMVITSGMIGHPVDDHTHA